MIAVAIVKATGKLREEGRALTRGREKKGIISGSKQKKKMGIISELESVSHFRSYTIIFTFSIHITISEQRDTRFNGIQPVLLALCLPFTVFDFFACFSWKLRSGSKRN